MSRTYAQQRAHRQHATTKQIAYQYHTGELTTAEYLAQINEAFADNGGGKSTRYGNQRQSVAKDKKARRRTDKRHAQQDLHQQVKFRF